MINREMKGKIRNALFEKSLRIADIAREIGVHNSMITRTLNGYERPYGKVRDYLCELMDITPDELEGKNQDSAA